MRLSFGWPVAVSTMRIRPRFSGGWLEGSVARKAAAAHGGRGSPKGYLPTPRPTRFDQGALRDE
jgi:hypothetical protein